MLTSGTGFRTLPSARAPARRRSADVMVARCAEQKDHSLLCARLPDNPAGQAGLGRPVGQKLAALKTEAQMN